jgi:hypothetical protein
MTKKDYSPMYIRTAQALLVLLVTLAFFSCSYLPFHEKTDTVAKADDKLPAKEEKGERLDQEEPKPGDIKVLDGIEYIYSRNKKYMLTPYEPEYVWIRKDQYTPGLGETVMSAVSGTSKKERDELEARLAKLEAEYKKKGIAPQMTYPEQMAALPAPPAAGMTPRPSMVPQFSAVYPSPGMRRRIIVLPVADETSYKKERIGEFTTGRLISRLENTRGIICIDPGSVDIKAPLTRTASMKTLNEVYGVQAVVKGTLSDRETAPHRGQTSYASPRLDIEVYDTETGTMLKHFSGGEPLFSAREQGDTTGDKALTGLISLSIEMISDDLLRSVLAIDWHARVASLEGGKIYINAGRQSGLEKGTTLEVFSPGIEIMDSKTHTSLGRAKGTYKGEIRVSELFGVDASWAASVNGGGYVATDLVYLKKE